jgi:hypothetical protein
MKKGFTLIEVLVGLGLIIFVIVGMLYALTDGAKAYKGMKERLIAARLLQDRMETIDARLSASEVASIVSNFSGRRYSSPKYLGELDPRDPQSFPICDKSFDVFFWQEIITPIDPPLVTTLIANPLPNVKLYLVKEEIIWPAYYNVEYGQYLPAKDAITLSARRIIAR